MVNDRFRPVELVGLNPRSQKIIKAFNNSLLMQEYDSMGRPLCFAPNGKQGIFCVARDFSWRGWFVLDDDVRFLHEERQIHNIIESLRDHNEE